MIQVLFGGRIPLPLCSLNLTSCVPQFYLIETSRFNPLLLALFNLNLTSALSGISNHGLETTVYRLLVISRKLL